MQRAMLWVVVMLSTQPLEAAGVPVVVTTAPSVEVAMWANVDATAAGIAEQLTELANVVTNIKHVFGAVNRVASLCRETLQVMEFLSNLDSETVLRAAKDSMYKAMPELEELEREVLITAKESEALMGGWFQHNRSYHDREMSELLGAAANASYAASVYPLLFPEQERFKAQVSEAKKLLVHRYRRLGEGLGFAKKVAATQVMQKKVEHASKEAEKKKRIDLELEALQAQSGMQTMINTQTVADAEELEIAEQEAARLRKKERSENLRRAVRTHLRFDEIGTVH